jgi:hypothetical protein
MMLLICVVSFLTGEPAPARPHAAAFTEDASPKRQTPSCVRRRRVIFAVTTSMQNPRRATGNGCWPWERLGQSVRRRCRTNRARTRWAYDETSFAHNDDRAAIAECQRSVGGRGYEYMVYEAGRGWKRVSTPLVMGYLAELYRPVNVPYLPEAYARWRQNPGIGNPMINVGMGVRSDAAVSAAVNKLCRESRRIIGLYAGAGQGAVTLQRRGVIFRALNACTTGR